MTKMIVYSFINIESGYYPLICFNCINFYFYCETNGKFFERRLKISLGKNPMYTTRNLNYNRKLLIKEAFASWTSFREKIIALNRKSRFLNNSSGEFLHSRNFYNFARVYPKTFATFNFAQVSLIVQMFLTIVRQYFFSCCHDVEFLI